MAAEAPVKGRPTPDDSWTPLQRAVEARYRECVANGGHVESGEFVQRPGGLSGPLVPLAICARCEVPYRR